MKTTILALVMVCYSITSFANILEVKATNDEIRDAIIVSLRENDLKCVNMINNSHSDASKLIIGQIFDTDYTLTISSDNSQPIIRMEKVGVPNLSKVKFVMDVTTDANFKVVTALESKIYEIVKVRVNIGTILNPVFREEMSTGKPLEHLKCR